MKTDFVIGDYVKTKRGYHGTIVMIMGLAALVKVGVSHYRVPLEDLIKEGGKDDA